MPVALTALRPTLNTDGTLRMILDTQSMVSWAIQGGRVSVLMPGGHRINATLICWKGKRARVRFLNGSERTVPQADVQVIL